MDDKTPPPPFFDQDIDDLADQLASIRGVDKIEAIRGALRNELRRAGDTGTAFPRLKTVEDIVRELHKKAGPNRQPITKEWIDSLYDET